jgi:hypothetical protein
MKTLMVRSLAAAVLLLSGTAIAGAVPALPPLGDGVLLVADTNDNDFAAKRDEYLRKAQDELQSWQTRMGTWTDQAKAQGSEAGEEARRNLDKAWTDVKANWQKLQAAAPQTWDKARASFEDASQRMKSAWEKIEPQG